MNDWVILRRARITVLIFLVIICLAWATLFAIFLSHEWSFSSPPQNILVASFLSLDVCTAILLYLMAVMPTCPWWDVGKMFAVLVAHTGSSVLFTLYKRSFSCHGYETECKDFVLIIFIGCWVFSVTTLCLVISLVVMAFIPRPVDPGAALESLPLARTEEYGLPSNPGMFKAGNATDERRPTHIPIRTGLPVVTYNNVGELPGESWSPDRTTSPANGIRREAITLEPPHLRQGFQSKNARHGNENRMHVGATSTRNTPGGSSSIGYVPQRAASFSQKYLSYSPTSCQVPIQSRAPMIRPAMGEKNTPIAKVRPNRTSTFPKLRNDALPPIPLRNSSSQVTMPRDRATEYPPRVFSGHTSNNSALALASSWGDSQPTYPGRARTTTPDVSFHPSPPNVHSVMVEPPPYDLLPSVPTPRVERIQDLSAFWGPRGTSTSAGNDASFATGGSNAPFVHSASQPSKPVQRSGEGTAGHAGIHPVKKIRFLQRSSDGQVLDETQWWGLVRGAATKP